MQRSTASTYITVNWYPVSVQPKQLQRMHGVARNVPLELFRRGILEVADDSVRCMQGNILSGSRSALVLFFAPGYLAIASGLPGYLPFYVPRPRRRAEDRLSPFSASRPRAPGSSQIF